MFDWRFQVAGYSKVVSSGSEDSREVVQRFLAWRALSSSRHDLQHGSVVAAWEC
jgi:hypothetical protein